MHDETREAINDLLDTLESGDWHVSSIEADEYLSGAGFDPDEVMGTEVHLTVIIPGNADEDEDNPFRVN